jgi:drug/metabolite transporter (DMT)-like permease
MLSLGAILLQNLATRVTDRVDETVDAAKRNAIAGLVIGVLVATAYGLALVATAVLLAERYGTVPALFSLAGGFLLLALIVFAVVATRNRRERELRRIRRGQLAARRDMMAAAAAVATKRPFAATGIALALGFLLAPKRSRHNDD